MKDVLIKVKDISAIIELNNGESLVTVDRVSFELENGKSYAIVGKSGSGKTSLVSVLGLLNSSFTGDYEFRGSSVKSLKDRELSRLRSRKFGFVFQNYSLISHLKVWENIELSLLYAKLAMNRKQRKERILEVLSLVGLNQRGDDHPNNLSGGEQQRVAIARALVASPEVLICDEPTGALDKKTGELVMEILMNVVTKEKATLILVTHDQDLAKKCDTVMHMDEGRVVHGSNDI